MNKAEKIADLKARGFYWPIAWDAVELIASSENCFLQAYKCQAGKYTCGWGETDGVTADTKWTKEQADTRFHEEIEKYTKAVVAMCKVNTTPQQLGAMVSLGYNIGLAALRTSTVMKAHNAEKIDAAARAFGLWNKCKINGVLTVSNGLTARRAAEAALYLRPEESPFVEPSIQAVVPESTLAKSPINVAGATGVTMGVGSLVGPYLADAMPAVQQVKEIATVFSVNPLVVAGVAVTAAGAVSMFYRYKQRKDGWA